MIKLNMNLISRLWLLAFLIPFQLSAQKKTAAGEKMSAYLFVYFTGNIKSEEAIHFAISNDGFTYRALNDDQPVLSSANISSSGGVRDPHILRGADGKTFTWWPLIWNRLKDGIQTGQWCC